jgi:hypothetical protein
MPWRSKPCSGWKPGRDKNYVVRTAHSEEGKPEPHKRAVVAIEKDGYSARVNSNRVACIRSGIRRPVRKDL